MVTHKFGIFLKLSAVGDDMKLCTSNFNFFLIIIALCEMKIVYRIADGVVSLDFIL